jgi:hypothetical protein
MGIALRAMSATLPGSAAYLAELRTATDVDEPDPAAALVAELEAAAVRVRAAGGDAGPGAAPGGRLSSTGANASSSSSGASTAEALAAVSPALAAALKITPGLLASPLAAVVGGLAAGTPAEVSRPASAARRVSRTGGQADVLGSAMLSEIKEQLVFK